jgi:hypothetical protein
MKAYGLLALMLVLSPSVGGTPARAQAIPEELRRFYQERREEFRERREEREERERREAARGGRDEAREMMFRLHRACEEGDRRACIHFGWMVGENREHREGWRRDHPELFGWERR